LTNIGSAPTGVSTSASNNGGSIINNIIYDLEKTGDGSASPIGIDIGMASTSRTFNNTVFDITLTNAGSSGDARGFGGGNDPDIIIRNNIAMACTTVGSGTSVCYETDTARDSDFNMSDVLTPVGAEPIFVNPCIRQFRKFLVTADPVNPPIKT